MTKNELIEKLQAIDGNPEILIKESIDGGTFKIDEVEECLTENDGEDIYTFSLDRKEELDIEDTCIVLWI